MHPKTSATLVADVGQRNDPIESARLAGMLAAKQTSHLIPLCHSIPVAPVTLDFALSVDGVTISATAQTFERTGVEMEALTACAVAALTIYSTYCKHDRTMSVEDVCLWEKIGGKSGHWQRDTSVHANDIGPSAR